MTNEKEIKYFSMFSGVGGFELGLRSNESNISKGSDNSNNPKNKQFKWKCVGLSEIDKYVCELLRKKFPTVKNYGNAREIDCAKLPDFDMLCGGFPCQAFSIAGKRRGFQDTRGTLFFEVARILEAKRPKVVFLENVKGLLNHNKGETFKVILQTLDELGYEVQWMVLNSKFFGVPQNRERVFIIGSLRGERRPEILPFGEGNSEVIPQKQISNTLISGYHKIARGTTMVGERPKMLGLLKQESERRTNECPIEINLYLKKNKGNFTIREIAERIDEPLSKVEHYFRKDKFRAIPRPKIWFKLKKVLSFDETYDKTVTELTKFCVEFEQTRRVWDTTCSPTLNASQSPFINTTKIRRLTPTECERLQGFPDGYTKDFSDTQRYRMMGNAVTVNVIKAIGEKL